MADPVKIADLNKETSFSDDDSFVFSDSSAGLDKRIEGADMRKNISADIENITALKLFEGTRDGQTIELLGYHERGDGGGGVLYWDATSTEDDNGGTIFQVAGVATGRWKRLHVKNIILAEWFGAIPDNTTDYADEIQAAIDFVFNAFGGEVHFRTEANYMIGKKIILKDRVSLVGTGRSVEIKATSGFSDDTMIECLKDVGSTESMFHSYIKGITLNSNNNAAIQQVVLSRAWQENCGLRNLLIRNVMNRAVTIKDGYGGAAYLRFEDVEIFAGSPDATAGIYVEEVSSVGAFIFHLVGCTIAGGSSGNRFQDCVYMESDTLMCNIFHTEYTEHGITFDGKSSGHVSVARGSFNNVNSVIRLKSTWLERSLVLDNIVKNGATNAVKNEVSGKNITSNYISNYVLPSVTSENTALAWAVINPSASSGGSTPIIESYNVASVSNPATGQFDITYETPLTANQRVVVANTDRDSADFAIVTRDGSISLTQDTLRLRRFGTFGGAYSNSVDRIYFAVFGKIF